MLNINEIFRSIDGECNAWGQGSLTTFIRLQGCNLSPPCSYCDTKYAQDSDKIVHELTIPDIIEIIKNEDDQNDSVQQKVTITGGEPLLQCREVVELIERLVYEEFNVSIETNGTILIPREMLSRPACARQISWIIDYKLSIPHKVCIDNFWNATSQDWIKFVITKPEDFQYAVNVAQSLISGGCKARIAFSPVMKNNDIWPVQWLAERLIEKQLWDITLNLQIHKLIWPDKAEGISLLPKLSK